MTQRHAAVIVLAAGEGTRMKSALPKVLHPVLGTPMLGHVLGAAHAPDRPVVVVVGHERELVADYLQRTAPQANVVVQESRNGTGHAVRLALAATPELTGDVLVVYGDTPLLRRSTLDGLLAEHADRGNAATVLTARLPDPTGYGRIVRDDAGGVVGIVEQADATPDQRAIDEINTGIYVFDVDRLRAALARITTDNAQGEEYLTDVIAVLHADGERIGAQEVADPNEPLGVNDRVQLAQVGRLLRDRVLEDWMRAGVTVVDPQSTWVEVGVQLAADVTLLPNVHLHGSTTVAGHAVIGPNVSLTDSVVGARAEILNATCIGVQVDDGAQVGPYTFLRPGTVLRAGSRAGGFVEMKNAELGEGSKVPHLSYVGDATIGEHTNIGAATVFVNYDGVAKHHTQVGSHVRIGSDTMLVAPVTVGDGAYTAAGSVITDDVPAGAMGVGRARQRTIRDWVLRRRAGSPSAQAAEVAKDAAGGAAARHDGAGDDGATPDTDADAGATEGGHGQ